MPLGAMAPSASIGVNRLGGRECLAVRVTATLARLCFRYRQRSGKPWLACEVIARTAHRTTPSLDTSVRFAPTASPLFNRRNGAQPGNEGVEILLSHLANWNLRGLIRVRTGKAFGVGATRKHEAVPGCYSSSRASLDRRERGRQLHVSAFRSAFGVSPCS